MSSWYPAYSSSSRRPYYQDAYAEYYPPSRAYSTISPYTSPPPHSISKERERKQFSSSPPPPLPTILHPSPSYLATSLTPSTPLQNPSTQRKLLILDLNGTLLIRPKRRIESYQRHPLRKGYQHPDPGLKFRPVHPRPYMPTFKQYLFLGNREGEWTGEGTKAWLDVMIWSSAQPHSVGDMVEKCFGVDNGAKVEGAANINGWYSENEHENENETDDVVAIWARDTLGLSEMQYRKSPLASLLLTTHFYSPPDQKTQTTKDLEKPWSALSPTLQCTHNAQTTLLLDDSPLKAQLQPWNHVCIREYNGELRRGDLEVLGMEHRRVALDEHWNLDEDMVGNKRKRKEDDDDNRSNKKLHSSPNRKTLFSISYIFLCQEIRRNALSRHRYPGHGQNGG